MNVDDTAQLGVHNFMSFSCFFLLCTNLEPILSKVIFKARYIFGFQNYCYSWLFFHQTSKIKPPYKVIADKVQLIHATSNPPLSHTGPIRYRFTCVCVT